MDYEKKYNEALERAKEQIEACGDNEGRKRMIYAIFPELVDNKDERIRRFLITIVNNLCAPNFKDVERKDVLAYLEKQKEQKPEWSKEDEEMRNALWNLLKIQYPQDYYMTGAGIKAGKFRDWLKALKPHWKPSEEQMKALEAATVRYQSTGLESLYEDLKKL